MNFNTETQKDNLDRCDFYEETLSFARANNLGIKEASFLSGPMILDVNILTSLL